MAQLWRTRVAWLGFPGAPGVSTFYTVTETSIVEPLAALFQGISAQLPSAVTVQVQPEGDRIEDTTGDLVGAWAGPEVAPVVGSGAAGYAAPVGACINWATGTVLDGSRVGGRTFLVPLSSGNYDIDGTLGQGARSAIQTAAATFFAAVEGNLVIWHRPFAGLPAVPPRAARPSHLGGHALVTAFGVPDKAVVLKSRRD